MGPYNTDHGCQCCGAHQVAATLPGWAPGLHYKLPLCLDGAEDQRCCQVLELRSQLQVRPYGDAKPVYSRPPVVIEVVK